MIIRIFCWFINRSFDLYTSLNTSVSTTCKHMNIVPYSDILAELSFWRRTICLVFDTIVYPIHVTWINAIFFSLKLLCFHPFTNIWTNFCCCCVRHVGVPVESPPSSNLHQFNSFAIYSLVLWHLIFLTLTTEVFLVLLQLIILCHDV